MTITEVHKDPDLKFSLSRDDKTLLQLMSLIKSFDKVVHRRTRHLRCSRSLFQACLGGLREKCFWIMCDDEILRQYFAVLRHGELVGYGSLTSHTSDHIIQVPAIYRNIRAKAQGVVEPGKWHQLRDIEFLIYVSYIPRSPLEQVPNVSVSLVLHILPISDPASTLPVLTPNTTVRGSNECCRQVISLPTLLSNWVGRTNTLRESDHVELH